MSSPRDKGVCVGWLALVLLSCHDASDPWIGMPPAVDPHTIATCAFCPTPFATDFQCVARGADEMRDLSVSPDGRRLLAVRMERMYAGRYIIGEQRGAVVVIDPAAGTIAPIFEPGEGSVYGPTWLSDGLEIAALLTKTVRGTKHQYSSTWIRGRVVDGASGALSTISPSSPSPAGSKVLRTVTDHDPPQFFVVGETGTRLSPVAVAPDGDHFVGKVGDSFVLGWMSHPADASRIGTATAIDVTWSPDGQRIAYASPGIFLRPSLHDATPTALSSGHRDDRCPRFSPDGHFVAYVTYGPRIAVGDRTWFASNVMLTDESGTQRWKLTEGAAECSCPAWSRDGWLYVACNVDGNPFSGIYRMHAAPVQAGPTATPSLPPEPPEGARSPR